MSEFDKKAAEWDKNPMHWDRSEAIANEIKALLPLNKEMRALEYGAGTGITSFLLKDLLKEITLMDNSTEMVKVMNDKISASRVTNMSALNFDLEKTDYNNGTFDLIFTQMVLHHVVNISNIIERFYRLLNNGGYLAIADLYSEDGSFHGDGFDGHMGFDIGNLTSILKKKNFHTISHKECFIIDRKISDIESRQFPVFLLIAKK
jgi:ubiquinone/menaquinone biosynthesis C-methylase UbiE